MFLPRRCNLALPAFAGAFLLLFTLFIATAAHAQVPGMALNRGDWWRNGASLDMDFYNNRYMVSTTAPATYTSLTAFITAVGGTFSRPGATMTASGASFYLAANQSFLSRASTATYFDNSGVLQTSPANTARTDYDPSTLALHGTLIEEARTNSIRNSTMVGSVAGTPGTLPITWQLPNNLGTLSYAVIGSGTESGIPYLDLRISGTVSNNYIALYVDTSTSTPASPGQTWTASAYFRLVSGSLANIIGGGSLFLTGRNASGTSIEDSGIRSISLTSSPLASQRVAVSGTLGNSAITRVSIASIWSTVPGSTIDFTLRTGAPQLELGAFATSFIPTSGTTVTRAADVYTDAYSGTYFDSSGVLRNAPANTPRLDYDPSTLEPRGILIEENRTNLLTNSKVGYGPWSGPNVTTPTVAIAAPDGTSPVVRLTEDTATTSHQIYTYPSVSAGVSYTFSVYVKDASGNRNVTLALYNVTDNNISYLSVNPTTGQGTYIYKPAYTITNAGNGWWRLSVTGAATISSMTPIIKITNGTSSTYTGDGSSGFYVWGAQFEKGSFATSYIATSGTTVTRASDTLSIPTSGSWYNSAAGTLFASAMSANSNVYAAATYPNILSLSNNGTPSWNAINISFVQQSANPYTFSEVYNAGTKTLALYGSIFSAFSPFKTIMAYQNNDQAFAADGTSGGTGSVALPSTFTKLSVGNYRNYYLNGWVRRAGYFPTREPDSSLLDYTR